MDKRIGMRQDGKNYTFTPGKGGSLTAINMNKQQSFNPLNYTPKKRAKVISMKRQNIATALAGGTGY